MMVEQPKSYMSGNSKIWYLPSKGKTYYHCLDGPAIENTNGTKIWYLNDELHREDGPAIEWADGINFWYLNNNRHREDGPTVEYPDGSKKWYLNNELHREDGPAVEHADGSKDWFLNGNKLPKKEVESWLNENNINLKTNEGKMAFKLRWC